MSKNKFVFSKYVGPCPVIKPGVYNGLLKSIEPVVNETTGEIDRIKIQYLIDGIEYPQYLFINAAEGKKMSSAEFFGRSIQQATSIFDVDEAIEFAMKNDISLQVEYRNGFVNINPVAAPATESTITTSEVTPMPKPTKKVAKTSELDEMF